MGVGHHPAPPRALHLSGANLIIALIDIALIDVTNVIAGDRAV